MPKCSLVTPTYNWPEALELLLLSIMNQTVMPNEVIIADDGSKSETKELIEHFQTIFPVPLIHIWHEDIKNRKPRIMNKAIAKASFDYIIEIDGDIIMNKYFVEDHLRFAEKGFYLYGSRVNIKQSLLADLFSKKIINFCIVLILLGLIIFIFIKTNEYNSGTNFGVDDIKNENESFTSINVSNPILNEKITYISSTLYLVLLVVFDLVMTTIFINYFCKKN